MRTALLTLLLVLTGVAFAQPGAPIPPVVGRTMARFGISGQRPVGLFSTGAAAAVRAEKVRFKDLGGDLLTVDSGRLRLTTFSRGAYDLDGSPVDLGALSPGDPLLVCSTGEGTVSLVVSLAFAPDPPPLDAQLDPIPAAGVHPPRGWAGTPVGERELVMHPRRYQGAFRPLLLLARASSDPTEEESPFLLLGERPFGSGTERVYLLFHAGQPLLVDTYLTPGDNVVAGFALPSEAAELFPVFRGFAARQ